MNSHLAYNQLINIHLTIPGKYPSWLNLYLEYIIIFIIKILGYFWGFTYPIPKKKDLIQRLYNATIFSKFDMKYGFWKIQVTVEDRYKTTFTIPFGHYEWNVMSFGPKNAPSEFQNIMTDIFNAYNRFSIVYIDDVLIFSNSIEEHFQHLRIFQKLVRENGLVIFASKIKLFPTKIRFLGFEIYQGTIKPIQRAI